ncbi:MAG: hypothetical protein HY320_06455 [Armatimonadetes bacterium]|nr:hypothetical protein [Armatimonadota bacterium]
MTRRLLILLPALGLLVIAADTSTQAGRRQGSGVRIGKARITPKRLPGEGGNIVISVPITTSPGVAVQSAEVRAQIPGISSRGPSVSLAASRGRYVGTLRAPFNRWPTPLVITLFIEVQPSVGAPVTSRIGAVKQAGFQPNPDLPPPPPF